MKIKISSFLRSVLLISTVIVHPSVTEARKGGGLFTKNSLGCWKRIKDNNITQYICFRSNGTVYAANINHKEAEGLANV
ncbi:hypothetical protein, partial [Bacillus amyloliquefaciens]|uniref:hypothetical protein n=2 Tax=Bacteria TaxID=2 RepID=UPI002852AAAC